MDQRWPDDIEMLCLDIIKHLLPSVNAENLFPDDCVFALWRRYDSSLSSLEMCTSLQKIFLRTLEGRRVVRDLIKENKHLQEKITMEELKDDILAHIKRITQEHQRPKENFTLYQRQPNVQSASTPYSPKELLTSSGASNDEIVLADSLFLNWLSRNNYNHS